MNEDQLDHLHTNASSNQSGSNDFVKKLFQMLQQDNYKNIVRWTKNGDSFVVIDTNEFTKDILPRHFKHSNFASFVRQLNKYDFHKVKISNDAKKNYEYGDDAWEFKHPEFRINDRNALDNIKRKGPNPKKPPSSADSSTVSSNPELITSYKILLENFEFLKKENSRINQEINILKLKNKSIVDNLVVVKSLNERYYNSITILLNSLRQGGMKIPHLDFPNPNEDMLKPAPIQPPPLDPLHGTPQQPPREHKRQYSSNFTPIITQSPQIPPPSTSQPVPQSSQTPVPTNQTSGNATFATGTPNSNDQSPMESPRNSVHDLTANGSVLTTNIPNPKFHVLLVEDDNVCIQLCRKFLVKYGCQVTVVTDGLNAISTVENHKYDLVLMDIVMPNLDGATATSVIRSFDTKTPIIAMTGNIEENDLVTYLQNGMSDILAKPFTKDDLYSILSKHLLGNEPVNVVGINNEFLGDDQVLKKQRLE